MNIKSKIEVYNYFEKIKTQPLDYWDHRDVYDYCKDHKIDNEYKQKIRNYIFNRKFKRFDARSYAPYCYKLFDECNSNDVLNYVRAYNLIHIFDMLDFNDRIHDKHLFKTHNKIKNFYVDICFDNIHFENEYENKEFYNTIINTNCHNITFKNMIKQNDIFFDKCAYILKNTTYNELYLTGKCYFRRSDFYIQGDNIIVKKFKFYNCNIVVTDESKIYFEKCKFEKVKFFKSKLFNNHEYKIEFSQKIKKTISSFDKFNKINVFFKPKSLIKK